MRILQVTNGYPPRAFGGVETHTQRLADALRNRGHELHIFARHSDPEGADGDVVHEHVDGLPVTSVVNDMRGGSFRDHFLSAPVASAFRNAMKEARPEIVHFQHLIGLSSDLPRIARETPARCVATVHEYWYACHRVMLQRADLSPCSGPAGNDCVACVLGHAASRKEYATNGVATGAETPASASSGILGRLRSRFFGSHAPAAGPPVARERFDALRAALGCYARITTPSHFVVEEFARQQMPLPPSRTRALALGLPALPPGPQAPRTIPISPEAPLRLVFVGHLLPHKGPQVLLRALRLASGLPVQLDLHGTRWPGHAFEEELGPLLAGEPRARAHGRFANEDLHAILSRADVLVVPSTCPESYGIATREAHQAGRPVVSTDRGALPESIRDGVDGLVVPGEDPEALAGALRRLVEEPDLLARLSAGAAAAEIPSMSDYAARIEKFLYEEG